jgi:hypothetical protein
MEQLASNSATADTPVTTQKRPRGRPPGTSAIVMAMRRTAAANVPAVSREDTPPAMLPIQRDHRGGKRQGAGRPPRDPAAREAWEAAQAARRVAVAIEPPVKLRRGGARPNGGRRKGTVQARASETALAMAARHLTEVATLVARHRREMRAWITRSKLTGATTANGAIAPHGPF